MDYGEERSGLVCRESCLVSSPLERPQADEIRQLFGGSAVTKEFLFKLSDYSSATWTQSKSWSVRVVSKLSGTLDRLCGFHRRCGRFHHRRCASRCRQDPYPERQLWIERRRCHHYQGDDQAGGYGRVLQGTDSQGEFNRFFFSCIAVDEMCILHILNYASDPRRRPQARVLVHARAEPDPLLRQIW